MSTISELSRIYRDSFGIRHEYLFTDDSRLLHRESLLPRRSGDSIVFGTWIPYTNRVNAGAFIKHLLTKGYQISDMNATELIK